MSELKPCPHCRGTWIVVNRPANGSHLSVKCKECNAHGPGHAGITEAEAVAAWNTRPQPTASVDAEQVWQEAWDAYHGEPWPRSISESEQAIAVIRTAMEAYGDARADAARREALDRIAALEAKLAEKDALLRECGEQFQNVMDRGYISRCIEEERPDHEAVIAALAKIKNATDAD